MTEREIAELEARWHRAVEKNPHPRILTRLPLRTRLRLAAHRAVNVLGCWLCDHGHCTMARLLWQACGMW